MTLAPSVVAALPTVIAVSLFKAPATTSTSPVRHELTWAGLVELLSTHERRRTKDGRGWSPAVYRPGTTRRNENVDAVSCLVGDLDHIPTDDYLEIKARLIELGLAFVAYSTFSSTAGQLSLRVVVPLAAPVPAERWSEVWRGGNYHIFGGRSDPQTKDWSRFFYLPAASPDQVVLAEHHDGGAFVAVTIPEVPVGHLKGPVSGDSNGAVSHLGYATLDFVANGAPVNEQRGRALAATRAYLAAGHSIEDTAAAIWRGLQVCPCGDANDPWTYKHALAFAEDLDTRPAPPLPKPAEISFSTNGTSDGFDAHPGSIHTTEPEEWTDPQAILNPTSAPRLPLERFPKEIRDSAEDAARRIRCPIDYVVWSLLVALAGLIGRGAGIRPRMFDDWTERLSFYVALIGPPSWMKSPALDFGTLPLRRQQKEDADRHTREVVTWQAACAALRKENPELRKEDLPPRPVERRWVTGDATVEKLSELLLPDVSRGMTVVRDELAGWIYDLNKYRAGSDRQFFLQANSGGAYPVDRIRGSTIIPDLLLNIVGGIQPEVAQQVFNGGPVDGLDARMTAVWPDWVGRWERTDRNPGADERAALRRVCAQLAEADWGALLQADEYQPTPYCRPTREGVDAFADWEEALMNSLYAGDYEGRAEGRAGKYRGLVARIALEFHLVEWAAGRWPHPRTVATSSIEDAIAVMTGYVIPMDRRVLGEYATPPSAVGGRRIARWILREKHTRFTVRDIRQHGWAGLTEEQDVLKALDWLQVAGWVRPARRDPHRVGRPPVAFDVNPAVHGLKT